MLPVESASPASPVVRSRAVLDPDGTRWPSLRQAARAYGLTPAGLRHRCANGLYGWRFEQEEERGTT